MKAACFRTVDVDLDVDVDLNVDGDGDGDVVASATPLVNMATSLCRYLEREDIEIDGAPEDIDANGYSDDHVAVAVAVHDYVHAHVIVNDRGMIRVSNRSVF